MKRKMLISIALIMIMLLNCVMPIFAVDTVVNGEDIRLNGNLFKAVKSSLDKQGIEVTANEVTYTLTLSEEEKASIKRLDLNEGAISDLTGLEAFTALEHLELSGNNLTKESNLGVLNSLPNLNYLDLSTNKLDDISEIRTLIDTLRADGTIILSGQSVTSVQSVYVDSITEEESNVEETADFELPTILELAGYIKSCWKSTRSVKEKETEAEDSKPSIPPSLSVDSIPMYITPETNKIKVKVCDETGKNPYLGMLEVVIYIYDDQTEAGMLANPNRASENILNGSKFTLYLVVHEKSSEAVTTMDTNLYNAIKAQLTAGQTINKELRSYPYTVGLDGTSIYGTYTYEEKLVKYPDPNKPGQTQERLGRVLTNVDTTEKEYIYDFNANVLYKYLPDDTAGEEVNTTIEETIISTSDTSGLLTSKAGYKIAFVEERYNETLYIQAYDDAKTFVIDDTVLTNDITSLILNNQQIRDLSGIEQFIGLKSELNVSHNYLSEIDPLYNLEEQKAYWEKQMIDKYTEILKTREYGSLQKSVKEAEDAKKGITDQEKNIQEAYNGIIGLLAEAADIDTNKSRDEVEANLESKANSILEILKSVYGYHDSEGKYIPGYVDFIDGYTDSDGNEVDGYIEIINNEIEDIYKYLSKLYGIYSKEYTLTTLLTPEMNYLTYEEYQEYEKTRKDSTESARGLLESEINYLKQLEEVNGLSDLDKNLLSTAFKELSFNTTEEKPLSKYFDEYLEGTALNKYEINEKLKIFREIGIYSEMANYCLIKRMNTDTAVGYCYEEEYLEKRIHELGVEDIPADLEQAVLTAIETETTNSELYIDEQGKTLYDIYKKYENFTLEYTNIQKGKEDKEEVYIGQGEYKQVNSLLNEKETYTKDDLRENAIALSTYGSGETKETDRKANLDSMLGDGENLGKLGNKVDKVIKEIKLYETVKKEEPETIYKSGQDEELEEPEIEINELALYNQMMTLANKLINGNLEKYIKLSRLKDLNISYNADLNDIERISELKSLYNLNASYCYISDVSDVDWASMVNLKRLYLGFNFISDMSPLTNLPNIKELDLSNNLLSGKLAISAQQYTTIFKNLKELNLSGNQISDIENLIIFLDYISGGNYANYLAREDTLNLDLSNQNIDLVIEDPISLEEYPTTINVELPKIFTQLQKIDTQRTSFGETSQRGRVEFEGGYVTLNTRTPGEKLGTVVVIAQTGDGSEVETCIGEGTKATIHYTVVESKTPVDPDTNTNTNTDPVDPDTNTNTNTDPVDPDTNTNTTPVDPDVPSINTEDLGYTEGEEYITGISAKTPVEDFKEVLLNGLDYTVQVTSEKDGEEVTTGYMKTGMYVKVLDENGNVIKDQNGYLVVYQVVVKGDINGDGYADASDSILIKAHRAEVKILEGAQFVAGDINEDGHVDVLDSKLLLYHRAEVSGYDLNFAK